MRKTVALALALVLVASSASGCSQPIDTGSSVPPQSQPLVALLALVGLGIGIAAYHHHNEHRGGGGGVLIVPPTRVIPPLFGGYHAAELADDPADFGFGVLETPDAGGQSRFALVSGGSFVAYALPAGYVPSAVAVDVTSGIDWFVDASGRVQGCLPPNSSTTTCTTTGITKPSVSDGLGAGPRAIAADSHFAFVALDAGGGLVKWFALNLADGTTTTSSYQSLSTAGLFPADFVISTPQGGSISGFTVFHADGRSEMVTLPPNASPSFTFAPVPLAAPSDVVTAPDGVDQAFYALTGSVATTYQITRYTNAANFGIGQLVTSSETIASNGQTGSAATPFALPLSSLHVDVADGQLVAIDANRNIVAFDHTQF